MMNQQPSVSIVVNTLNRGPYLDDALRALSGLNYSDYEVVVVNGPSTDNSSSVLARWATQVKLDNCSEPNLSVSRNVGIQAAAGEIICFIDDDAAPHPNWLTHLVAPYRDSAVGGVGGFTIDNTGTRWQVRKTICDRFGNAYNVSPLFDERPLSFPGTPCYPSLLGTNSSFRASALRAIGGFDHAFAYLLDETDVCLRLVDAGWKIVYEPAAMVYHQFAASHIRSPERVARTLYPSAVSKGYFIGRHGARLSVSDAGAEVDKYISDILTSNKWLNDHQVIGAEHRFSLDEDLVRGVAAGQRLEPTLDQVKDPPAIGPDPKRAQAVLEQTEHATVTNALRLAKSREAHAVKAGQTGRRADPQVAIPRLQDGRDFVARQSVFGLPAVQAVLGCRLGSGRRESGADRSKAQ